MHAHGGVGYEVDFMSNLFIQIPEFRRTLDASTVWQLGMNQAGLDTNTTIQFCMMQPSDLLNSLQFDAATNGRASMDYAGSTNWNAGGASLLFWAMGMRLVSYLVPEQCAKPCPAVAHRRTFQLCPAT